MFEELNNRRSRWRVFWPEVNDLPGAEEAIRLCYWFAFVAAGLTAAMGLLVFLFGGGDPSGLVGAVIVALIGVGVRRGWRSAALAGLLFLTVGLVVVLRRGGMPGVIDVLTFVAFISGVRGTFAAAKLRRLATNNPAEPIDSALQGVQAV
jgi:hypothetical protein